MKECLIHVRHSFYFLQIPQETGGSAGNKSGISGR